MEKVEIVWTDYLMYRLRMRGFDITVVENIVRYSSERYIDSVTGRFIAVGMHGDKMIVVPYELNENVLTPVTVHVTDRRQIKFRVKSGRFVL